jgi:hypothetical protein
VSEHDVAFLFDEYTVRFARGERPDVEEYLDRAGGGADELARLVDGYLQTIVPREPSEETIALVHAWARGESPLGELRSRRGLRRSDVVDALVTRLDLDAARSDKVARYLHELEAGLLDTARVSRRVYEVIAGLVGARASDLVALRPRPLGTQEAFLRADETAAAAAPPWPESAADERDEIDELFLGPR